MNTPSDKWQPEPRPDFVVFEKSTLEQRIVEWGEKVDRYYDKVWEALIRKHGPVQAINALKNWCGKLADAKYERTVKLLRRLSVAEQQQKNENRPATSPSRDLH